MRILLILSRLTVGGAQIQTINLAKGLAAKGVEVTIFSFEKSHGDLIDKIPANVNLIFPKPRPFVPKILTTVFLLVKTILSGVDLIYMRKIYLSVLLFGKLLRIPVVVTFVIDPREKENKYAKAFFNNIAVAWQRLRARLPDCKVANSHKLADECQSHFGFSEKPIVIYNGTDLESVRQRALEDVRHQWLGDKTIPLIVSVGRLVRAKDYATLIDAFAILNKRMEARLLIVGSGKEKNFLMKQISRLKLEDTVQLAGLQQNPYPFMASADLFVSSSISEGFSNSLLEALALGCPVVSTDHRFGANEIIENGKSGIFVPVSDSKAMAESIFRVLQDKTLAMSLGKEARQRAESFGVEAMLNDYEKLFEDVVKSYGRPRRTD